MSELSLKDQNVDLNSKSPMPNNSYNYCGNEMKEKNYDSNIMDETELGAMT